MKRFIALISMVLFVVLLAACGGSSSTNSASTPTEYVIDEADIMESAYVQAGYLKLTKDMIAEIEDTVNGQFWGQIIMLAVRHDFDISSEYTLTNLEVTNQRKTDDYTYTIYGRLYYKDDYGRTAYEPLHISYRAKEDEESEEGYDLVSCDLTLGED